MFSVLFSYKKYIRIDTETKIGINNIISICSVNVTVFVKIFIKIIIVHTLNTTHIIQMQLETHEYCNRI